MRVVAGEFRSANRAGWVLRSNSTSPLNKQREAHNPHKTLIWKHVEELQQYFFEIDKRVAHNVVRVQQAYKKFKIGPHHFSGSTGYGHGDIGRATLDQVYGEIMGCECGIVRPQFMSGTHAIASALFGVLRPGDCMLAVAGRPYDTLEEVIGLRGDSDIGSLADFGINYCELNLMEDGDVDYMGLEKTLRENKNVCVAYVQRSCGYSLRPTLSISSIAKIVEIVKNSKPNCLVLVDNCYGEFTEELEPGSVGADLVMGSLIKNPGGTIATGGGYVAGRLELVDKVAARLSAPGLSVDAGYVHGLDLRLAFQGFFLAPQFVGEALKGGALVQRVMSSLGYHTVPEFPQLHKPSFIQAIQLGDRQKMINFCQGIQIACPVGSYVKPVPGVTPGYEDEVLFADGTFIDGSTSELSADGPLKQPYVVYCQGGTHWTHWALALEQALQQLNS